MGQEMTICNTSIKLWGKNSVTRSIIAPKKSYFSPTQIAKFSFMFYLLGVEHDGKKFGIVTISSFDNIVVGFPLRLIGPALHYKPIYYSINSINSWTVE